MQKYGKSSNRKVEIRKISASAFESYSFCGPEDALESLQTKKACRCLIIPINLQSNEYYD